MLYLAANLLGLIGLVGVLYLTGWLADQVFMGGRGLRPVTAAGRFGLGAALWMGGVFLLASVQRLSATTLGLIALVILVIAWRQRRSTSDGLPTDLEADSAPARDPVAWLLGGALTAILVGLWLQVLWPQLSWDSNAYHLTIPRLFLEHGGFRRIPFNVYSNWPLNAQMLFALALVARDYILAKALHFAFGLATLLLVYRVVRMESQPWVGWLGGALFLVNPVVMDEFRAAYVDLAFAFFFLLAFVLLHSTLESREDQGRRLIAAGAFGGVAAGIKPTGIVAVGCLLALYLVVELRRGQPGAKLVKGLAFIALPAGLLLVPWLLKTWILTGNPLYPFFYPALGGPEWSAGLGSQLHDWQQGMGMGRSWLDYLLLPIRVILAGGPGYDHFDGRISPLWLVLVPMAAVLGRRQPLILRSLGVTALYFLFWALSSQQMRFLIPVLPFLAIACSLTLAELLKKLTGVGQVAAKWAVALGMVATLVVAGSSMVVPAWRMLERYLELGEEVMDEAVHPVFRFINGELPETARLMFVNTNHGFFCDREFIADSFFEASQINELLRPREGKSGISEALGELGISHLLIENRDRYVPWPQSLFEYLNDAELVKPLYRSPDGVYDVVEVVGASPSSP